MRDEDVCGNFIAPNSPIYFYVITDYAPGDNACPQVCQALRAAMQPHRLDVTIENPVFTGSFDTISAGYNVALAAIPSHGMVIPGTVVYHNVAPRKGIKTGQIKGEELYLAVLHNGTLVYGPNAGYSFSFIKDEIKTLYRVNMDDTDVQFRSRDLFPALFSKVLRGVEGICSEIKIKDAGIPDVPASTVVYVDSFGNVKTTLSRADFLNLNSGAEISVNINGVPVQMNILDKMAFSGGEGNVAFAPGSSILHGARLMEVFLVGGRAADLFINKATNESIKPGDKVEISIVS